MDECEALCNRIAIMVKGKLVCIGACEELKQKFQVGYNIEVKFSPLISSLETVGKIKEELCKNLNGKITDQSSVSKQNCYQKLEISLIGILIYNVIIRVILSIT